MSSSLFSSRDADLILHSNSSGEGGQEDGSSINFLVHRCVLSTASPFFEAMLSLPQPNAERNSDIPVIPMAEDGSVVETILRHIYPLPNPPVETLDELAQMLEVARKYDFTSVSNHLRQTLVAAQFLEACPLRVYAIASRYDLDEEAKVASKATLCAGLDKMPLHDDLKSMSGFAYHRLLQLHKRRARDAVALLELPDDVRCMSCNGRRDTVNQPPRWWAHYKEAAKEELLARPTSDTICSLSFIQRAALASGCERCAGSILSSCWFFDQLRQKIDTLPATV
ncbi:hypothetical protein K466DRAFT_581549 [Polyporus arcularius HHB13444]|uniref:BTB domain-containing protein n=1 Tax=Polyporus arcularius HHB13444 TaxID=1314778 RepID=A0A5C3PYD4_9APHY|nr:hypothetical protein K466DRAFT_581549 [Polyporus arcularius HHB13444]